MEKYKVCVIGGGTGTIPVLTGLKPYKDVSLSVIVSATDDGGSNAVVRDEFGMLPLSDFRKSIIALAGDHDKVLRQLFTYRFSKGNGLTGHTLGNLMMMALCEILGGELQALDEVRRLFGVKEKIIPVTLDDVRLVAEYESGDIEKGEHLIDETTIFKDQRIKRFFSSPKASAYKQAVKQVLDVDYITIGPGDLYTSTLANIIIKGIPEALQKTRAKIIFITNLMTKAGQTRGMKVSDHIRELVRYMNRKPDFIVINDGKLPQEGLKRYRESGEKPIETDVELKNKDYKVIFANVVAASGIKDEQGDRLARSFVRHDSLKLGKVLYGIIKGEI